MPTKARLSWCDSVPKRAPSGTPRGDRGARMVMLILSVGALAAIIALLHWFSLRAVMRIVGLAHRLPAAVVTSNVWMRSRTTRSRLADRFPIVAGFILGRVTPYRFSGLPLTLLAGAAIYVAVLFSGLAEDVLEAERIVRIDNIVNAAFAPWRVEPLISVFLWITTLGSSPAIVSATIIATGFLWSQRRFNLMTPLWITCIGAITTTSIGKLLIGRHRPELAMDVIAPFSSFPSGHATAAMAAYGFLAYAIARALPSIRERFEVAYWTAVLVGLIGLSRLILGAHYLTDIIGGYLVGGFWLLIGLTIAEWTQSYVRAATEKRDAK